MIDHAAVALGQSAAALPNGRVTFVFTDIEGSTRLVRKLGEAYGDLLDLHDDLVTDAFTGAGGVLFGSRGDALFAAFVHAADAVAAAVNAQRALRSHPWNGHEVRVRMGIHTGDAVVRGGTYIGLEVHRVARICAAARGGQILVSAATAAQAASELPDGTRLVDLGRQRLKDLPDTDHLFELSHSDPGSGATT